MFEQAYSPRWKKGSKIKAILTDFLGDKLQDARLLDLGCATGDITRAVGDEVRVAVGADIDEPALREASDVAPAGQYVLGDGAALPFPDAAFDVVLCAQVYEHTRDQPGLAAEVWRVLQPGGICFFSGPNRLAVIEEHYWLPFLSWLPQKGADSYLKVTGRGQYYDIQPMTYWRLSRLWRGFAIVDYTPHLFRQPDHFAVDNELGRMRWVSALPLGLWKTMAPFLPNFNWILVREDERG